uniref:V-SNARE coiled-coil homology domain-containing protein n=1 Tax=Percolomonas cosmopolitus TaxID=63605 RepID=A0A7S1KNP3_9EUKA
MPIYYSAIFQFSPQSQSYSNVICQYPPGKPHLTTLSLQIASLLSSQKKMLHNCKRSFQQDTYHVNCNADGEYLYMALVDSGNFPVRISFKFLERVKTQYIRQQQTPQQAKSLLKLSMAHCNNLHNDKIHTAQNEISLTKDILVENIEKVLGRGEDLDQLLEQTDQLLSGSLTFKKTASKVKRNMRLRLISIVVLTLVLCCFVVTLMVVLLFLFLCVFPTTRVLNCFGGGGKDDETT